MSTIQPYEEKELLSRIAEGDEIAFAAVFRHYGKKVFPLLLRLTGSEGTAEDVLQNTFLSIWLNRARLPEIDNFSGYIYRAAGNQASNWLTKSRALQAVETNAAGQAPGPQEFTDQAVYFREAKRLVDEAVDGLPGQRKRIFRMYREEGYSYNEIAAQLNISPSTVRNSVASALESIREKLTEAGLFIFFILFFSAR
jgi:RNA polymerase sigma-70 factor (ECF subfamily)